MMSDAGAVDVLLRPWAPHLLVVFVVVAVAAFVASVVFARRAERARDAAERARVEARGHYRRTVRAVARHWQHAHGVSDADRDGLVAHGCRAVSGRSGAAPDLWRAAVVALVDAGWRPPVAEPVSVARWESAGAAEPVDEGPAGGRDGERG